MTSTETLITRLGRRKGVLISVVLTLLCALISVTAPNVQTYITFKLFLHIVDSGYYTGSHILGKLIILHYRIIPIEYVNSILGAFPFVLWIGQRAHLYGLIIY